MGGSPATRRRTASFARARAAGRAGGEAGLYAVQRRPTSRGSLERPPKACARGVCPRLGTMRRVRARGAATCRLLKLSASATSWPACRAPYARAVSCGVKDGSSGARSSSTALAARRGRLCLTSSGRSWHSSYAAFAAVSDGRASTYDSSHTSGMVLGEEPRRWVSSRRSWRHVRTSPGALAPPSLCTIP